MDDSDFLIDYVVPVDREAVRHDITSVLELILTAQQMHKEAAQSDNSQLEHEVKRCKRLKRALKQARAQSTWLKNEIDTISHNLTRAVLVRRSGLAELNGKLSKELKTLEHEIMSDDYPYKLGS
mmetsp:Transcript_33882/g.59052  ORF Transcript_33882/g.59052 Transcript_33882/m.59052 type:complete len:124 (-) Transcript_33882:1471-1842(-)